MVPLRSDNDRSMRIELWMFRCVCSANEKDDSELDQILQTELSQDVSHFIGKHKLSKGLIWMNAATQILTGHACLNYHLSKVNRSVQPLCLLSKVVDQDDTVLHFWNNVQCFIAFNG